MNESGPSRGRPPTESPRLTAPGAEVVVRTFRRAARLDPYYDSPALRRLIEDPDSFLEHCHAVLKHDRTSTVALVSLDGRKLVVKRYNGKGPWHRFRRALKPSRAMNNWKYARRFGEIGIRTPRPVMALEIRVGPMRGRAYFVAEFAEDARCLDETTRGPGPSAAVVDGVVDVFDKLAANRLSHGDTKATNWLVVERGVLLIDLDAASRHRFDWTHRQRLERDRQRFLANWSEDDRALRLFREGLYPCAVG